MTENKSQSTNADLKSADKKSKQSKEKIFSHLDLSTASADTQLKSAAPPSAPPKIKLQRETSDKENLKMFLRNLKENKAFVFHVTTDGKLDNDASAHPHLKEVVEKIIKEQKVKNCFIGKTLTHLLKDLPAVKLDKNYFAKKEIYKLDAAITHAKGSAADVGAIALVPDHDEPRNITLIPPIHIVIVDKKNIWTTMDDFLERFASPADNHPLPTNIVFVSGPSKTADLVGKLCFGIHGPKQLYVIINHS